MSTLHLNGAAGKRTPPKEETGHVRFLPIEQIIPAPENDQLYRPVLRDDPEIQELAASIRKHGVKEPLVVSRDNFIISGHRRRMAALVAGIKEVPVRVEDVYHDDPEFLVLLREHNRQRVKSAEEVIRELVVTANPDERIKPLVQYREARSRSNEGDHAIQIEGEASRSPISKAKMPMLHACQAIVTARRQFWPLTSRQVHYALLNDPPLRHASKPASRYGNTPQCYKDACDLLLRAHLEGLVPWEAIDDPTRPVITWDVHQGVHTFVAKEIDGLLKFYWRDRQQSQPRHIEIIGEKNTIANIIQPIAGEFSIPLTLGRGYASGTPRKKMVDRFKRSGRDALVLLALSDFDPEGEDIPQAFARSLRDEFGVQNPCLVKVGLTEGQVAEMNLPPVMTAKQGSSRRAKFVVQHGEAVHELEAIPPNQMQAMLRESIERVLDTAAYNHEIAAEKEDAATLQRVRQIAVRAIRQQLPQGGASS